MFNRVTLVGRVRSPLNLQEKNNSKFVEFDLIVARNKTNNNVRKTDKFNCIAWQSMAEQLIARADQGTLMLVDGHLQRKKTGSTEVVLEDFNILEMPIKQIKKGSRQRAFVLLPKNK